MNDYECMECRCTFDVPEGAERLTFTCPDCGSSRWRLCRTECNVGIAGFSTSWATENGGKGRRISQLDYGVRQPYYAKSQQAAIDEGKSRGLNVTKA